MTRHTRIVDDLAEPLVFSLFVGDPGARRQTGSRAGVG
jgi:hypothetical protein